MGSLSVNDFVKEVKAILQNKHTTLRFKSEAVLKLSIQLSNTKYYVFIHMYIMQNFKATQKIDFTPSEINDVTPAKVCQSQSQSNLKFQILVMRIIIK